MANAVLSGDMHLCLKLTETEPPHPHLGGPINASGSGNVKAVGRDIVVVGDKAKCEGAPEDPDKIDEGISGVMIAGKMVADAGKLTNHGGKIVATGASVRFG